MIAVRFLSIPDRKCWQRVCVQPGDQTDWFCVGYVRYSIGGGCWIARPRAHRSEQPHRVKLFAERSYAAAWLLVVGGFAQPRPDACAAMMQVAA